MTAKFFADTNIAIYAEGSDESKAQRATAIKTSSSSPTPVTFVMPLPACARCVAYGWMGENHFAAVPTAVYGAVLLMAAIAYFILQQTIIASQGPESLLRKAVGGDWKGKRSPLAYIIGIVTAFHAQWMAQALYVLVALIWLVPDRRIENTLRSEI